MIFSYTYDVLWRTFQKVPRHLMVVFLTLVSTWTVCPIQNSYGDPLVIDVNEGVFSPFPYAMADFIGNTSGLQEIQSIVSSDLNNSQYFRQVDSGSHIQNNEQAFNQPDYPSWSILKASILFGSQIWSSGDRWFAKVRLFDILNKKLMVEKTVSSENTRKLAHKIADIVYERVTGDKGYFNTKIYYIATSGDPRNKRRILSSMDYDGYGHRYWTSGKHAAVMPAVSYDGQSVAFLSFDSAPASIHVLNTKTGQDRRLRFGFNMLPFSPQFSPDGNSVLLSVSNGNQASIFGYHLASGNTHKITTVRSGGIDVSVSLSPDGRSMVFVSDRSGTPQIYKRLPSNSEIQLTKGPGRYYAVKWSPDGKWLTFVKKIKGAFYLGVMKSDGSGERMIARDHVIDYPSWAPNSRMIVFSAQQKNFGPFSLYIVDISANVLRQLPTPQEGDQPVWAPSESSYELA
jgi:TolB protein